jgi:hypothetical protein
MTTAARIESLSNLTIIVPTDPAHDSPAKSLLTDLLSPDEERNPTDKNTAADRCHLAVGHIVSMRVHPRVSVEAQQETKGRLEGELSDDNLSRNRAIAVNCIHERYIRRLSDSEVDYNNVRDGLYLRDLS